MVENNITMLHIKRDRSTGCPVYKMDVAPTSNCSSQSLGLNSINSIERVFPCPIIKQPHHMSFGNWYEENFEIAEYIIEILINAIEQFQSEKYIIKLHNTEQLRDELLSWLFAHSDNRVKGF